MQIKVQRVRVRIDALDFFGRGGLRAGNRAKQRQQNKFSGNHRTGSYPA